MATVIAVNRTKDYNAWREVFEEREGARIENKALQHSLYRSVDDPNTVVIVLDLPSVDDAKRLHGDPELKKAMQRGGVIDGTLLVCEEIETKRY